MLPAWFMVCLGVAVFVTLLATLALVKRSQSLVDALRALEKRLSASEGALENLNAKAASNSVELGAMSPTLKSIEEKVAALRGDVYRDIRDDLFKVRNSLWLQLDDLEREVILKSLGEYLDRRFSRLEADLYLMHLRDLNRYLFEKGRIDEAAFKSTLDRLNKLTLDDTREPVTPLPTLAETIRRKPEEGE